MAENENRRLLADTLPADKNAFLARKSIANYAPANPVCALSAVTAADAAMRAAPEPSCPRRTRWLLPATPPSPRNGNTIT